MQSETPETYPDTGRVTPRLIARSIDHSRLTYDGRAYIELPEGIDPGDAVVVSKAELARMEKTNVMLQGVAVAEQVRYLVEAVEVQSEREQFEIDYRTILASLQTHPDEHTKRLMWWAFRRGLAARRTQSEQLPDLLRKWWRFDQHQQPTSSWHEREDFIEELQKLAEGKPSLLAAQLKEID